MKKPKKILKPASANIFNVTCEPDGTGTGALLTFKLDVLLAAGESLDSVDTFVVLIDENNSGAIPNELPGSPTDLPNNVTKHSYECKDISVPCGVNHTVKVRVKIIPQAVINSNSETRACPCNRTPRTTIGMKPKFRSPATVTVSGVTCVQGNTGLDSTLSFMISVLRTDAESIESLEVILNGAVSGIVPSEQAGSPTTPSSGMKLHKFDCSGTVECGVTHHVKAIARIVLTSTPDSNEVSIACPACTPHHP